MSADFKAERNREREDEMIVDLAIANEEDDTVADDDADRIEIAELAESFKLNRRVDRLSSEIDSKADCS